jgi:hypothetical protein
MKRTSERDQREIPLNGEPNGNANQQDPLEQWRAIRDAGHDLPPALSELIDSALEAQPLFKTDSVLQSLRFADYDIDAGIGEFVDNSVEAKAKNVWVYVKPTKIAEGRRGVDVVGEVAIVDDGNGMSPETQRKSLVLGESVRVPSTDGRRGIGRFGVGMTMGAISLAKRIDVYTRTDPSTPFTHVYLDLDEVRDGAQRQIPVPEAKWPPEEYAKLLEGSSGTIVVLTKCDRLQRAVGYGKGREGKPIPASTQIEGIPHYLGRTFRKFIQGGLNITFSDGEAQKPVYLHDPLYMMGPTYWDATNEIPDAKAEQQGETIRIGLEVPGEEGEKAEVLVKISLLPKEWRLKKGAGGVEFARQRRIDENEGISVLRADREVLYGKVEYILGKRGQSAYIRPDRWWGMEISFPPELDDYFHVRFIKRGAEPVPSLRDKIRDEVWKSIEGLRAQIQKDWDVSDRQKGAEEGVFAEAEEAMAKAERKLPSGKRGANRTPEQTNKALDKLAEESRKGKYGGGKERTKEERKEELAKKPYSIVPVEYPASVFFDPEFLPGRIIVRLNVNHPFYKEVFAPLCGSIETLTDESDIMDGAETDHQRLARKAFLLVLMSFAKAESFFDDETLMNNLRSQWGMTLASALTE